MSQNPSGSFEWDKIRRGFLFGSVLVMGELSVTFGHHRFHAEPVSLVGVGQSHFSIDQSIQMVNLFRVITAHNPDQFYRGIDFFLDGNSDVRRSFFLNSLCLPFWLR
jgi:hypothetical protein